MKITKLTTFIMHVPVTKNIIGDSTHTALLIGECRA